MKNGAFTPFKYNQGSSSNQWTGCITHKNQVVHTINDLSVFYEQFGYTYEMAKQGILPDEYIWDTFFRIDNRNCANCYQLHMLEYLSNQDATFASKFKGQLEEWNAALTKNRAACDIADCTDKN